MSSLCASGTSLKVKTPQPSLKRRYAPKEMRAQKGSYVAVSEVRVGSRWIKRGTYNRHNIFLYLLGHRDDLHEYREIYLLHVNIRSSSLQIRGETYGSQKHRNADSLLGACHLGGNVYLELETKVWWRELYAEA
jgi:hypothetical protein